jgi:hypothetical protein
MPTRQRDDDREQRIDDEIIVDAYGPEEQALGWYYYLEGTLHFPYTARRPPIPTFAHGRGRLR